MSTVRRVWVAAIAAAALLMVLAASAGAASMVYVQGGNVFLANEDGTGAYQVTLDGSTADPQRTAYRSPTEADDGTIVAARGGEIVHLAQNGAVLARFVPHSGGYPLAAAVSPDGAKIAYNFSEITHCTVYAYSCGYYPQPGAAVTSIDGSTDPGAVQQDIQDGEWLDNTTLVLQLTASYIDYEVLGQAATHWFVPADAFNPFSSDYPYPEQPVASRDGAYLGIVMRPNASGGHPSAQDVLEIWRLNGPPPAVPTPLCGFHALDGGGIQDPHFLLDDSGIVWGDDAGVEGAAFTAADCQGQDVYSLSSDGPAIPGASQASFGIAAVHPGPRPVTTPAGAGTPSGGGAGMGAGAPAASPKPAATRPSGTTPLALSTRTVGSITRALLVKKGLGVRLACTTRCRYVVALKAGRTAARKLGYKAATTLGRARGIASGRTTVTLRLGAKARRALTRRLRHGHALALTLEVTATGASGRPVVHDAKLTVKG
jgi:hypothetical protein